MIGDKLCLPWKCCGTCCK